MKKLLTLTMVLSLFVFIACNSNDDEPDEVYEPDVEDNEYIIQDNDEYEYVPEDNEYITEGVEQAEDNEYIIQNADESEDNEYITEDEDD